MVSTPHERARLQRRLGLFSATALVVGEVIALGIFLTPATMVKSLGSPMWLLAIWVGMGVMALSGALCYGELAARLPEAGGGYVYLREAYGPRIAFLYGWKSFLIMDPGITAALAAGLASYIGYLVNLPPLGLKAAAIAVIYLVPMETVVSNEAFAAQVGEVLFGKLGSEVLSAIVIVAVLGSMASIMTRSWPTSCS